MSYLGECRGCGQEWIVETRRDMVAFERHLTACERSSQSHPSSSDVELRPRLAPGDGGFPRPVSGAGECASSSRVSGGPSPVPANSSSGNAAGGQSPTTYFPRRVVLLPGTVERLVAEVENYLRQVAR